MLTITCLHCGPVRVEDAAEVRYITGIVNALAVGHAPLGAITCPLCRDEVRARDVRADEGPFRFVSDGRVQICAWHPGHDKAHPANRGASHGICPSCTERMDGGL